jgi:hypothetical protein
MQKSGKLAELLEKLDACIAELDACMAPPGDEKTPENEKRKQLEAFVKLIKNYKAVIIEDHIQAEDTPTISREELLAIVVARIAGEKDGKRLEGEEKRKRFEAFIEEMKKPIVRECEIPDEAACTTNCYFPSGASYTSTASLTSGTSGITSGVAKEEDCNLSLTSRTTRGNSPIR